jgi:hypothetical protein
MSDIVEFSGRKVRKNSAFRCLESVFSLCQVLNLERKPQPQSEKKSDLLVSLVAGNW